MGDGNNKPVTSRYAHHPRSDKPLGVISGSANLGLLKQPRNTWGAWPDTIMAIHQTSPMTPPSWTT